MLGLLACLKSQIFNNIQVQKQRKNINNLVSINIHVANKDILYTFVDKPKNLGTKIQQDNKKIGFGLSIGLSASIYSNLYY